MHRTRLVELSRPLRCVVSPLRAIVNARRSSEVSRRLRSQHAGLVQNDRVDETSGRERGSLNYVQPRKEDHGAPEVKAEMRWAVAFRDR